MTLVKYRSRQMDASTTSHLQLEYRTNASLQRDVLVGFLMVAEPSFRTKNEETGAITVDLGFLVAFSALMALWPISVTDLEAVRDKQKVIDVWGQIKLPRHLPEMPGNYISRPKWRGGLGITGNIRLTSLKLPLQTIHTLTAKRGTYPPKSPTQQISRIRTLPNKILIFSL